MESVTRRPRRHPQAAVIGDDYAVLVRKVADGDMAAMERLLVQVQDVAWRFSMSVCGQPQDAEDAMQEALLRTYRHTASIREPAAFKPWLYRTVRNVCLLQRRKRVHEPARLESLDAPARGSDAPLVLRHPGLNPEELAGNVALRRRLEVALRALPGRSRAILFLREAEGLSTREVAHALRISEDSVKTGLRRARLALQASLMSTR